MGHLGLYCASTKAVLLRYTIIYTQIIHATTANNKHNDNIEQYSQIPNTSSNLLLFLPTTLKSQNNLYFNHMNVQYLPVVVRQIMAAAFCEKAASTAAIEVVVRVAVGLGVKSRKSSNTTR